MLKADGKKVWLGGNIGTPLLPLVPQMQETDFAVVELSSFQLMDMRRSPARAVITNLAPNHLDVHKDMDEYVDAKKNIFAFQNADGLLVLNADNAITAGFLGNGDTRFFSRQGKAVHVRQEGRTIYRGAEAVLEVGDILLPGVHNIENYMAAILAVEGLVEDATIRQVAKTFGGVEHRIELVRIKEGVKFYNDSIASSPSRTIAGLRSFREKVILIAGGYDKHIPYDVLGPEICSHVKAVYLCGVTAGSIRAAVENSADYTPGALEMVDCGDFESAVRAAATAAKEGDVVLMSPASASFDQFKNFMERGECFKKIVKEL
jgi:UDP-N-acetylmuramoylalanine--D-glutamate ligase